jgi:hypothetical protein
MPAVSKAQANLMRAAEHGADFPMAKKVRSSMTHGQMHDFAVGSQEGKPEHVIPGQSRDIVHSNTQQFKNKGMDEASATKAALRTAKKTSRHKNLGKFLHPRKDGRVHGS